MKRKNKEELILRKNNQRLAYREIDGEVVIINLEQRTLNTLNAVASRMWNLIDGRNSIGNIIEKIHQEFDVDEKILANDCFDFIAEITKKGLLRNSFSSDGAIGIHEGLFDKVREKAMDTKIPIMAHLDLTYRCNLDCIHCYIVPEDRVELSTDEVKDILKQLAQAGVLYLTLSGGEVLLRKDFLEIAQYARKLHFALRILTNGTLIDKEMVDEIVSLSPELVAISIYGTKPQIHDNITSVEGSFKKSLSIAKMLSDKGARLKISTIIMEQNLGDYRSVYGLSRQLGAVFQADYRITPKSDGDKSPLRVHINERDLPSLLADPILVEESEPEPHEVYSGMFNIIPCGAGHMSCYITPYGDVYPCVQLPIRCGNLRKDKFIDIWKKSLQLLEFRSVTISKLPSCSRCEFFNWCRLCVGLNYIEEGSIFSPSKRACREAQIMKVLGKKRR